MLAHCKRVSPSPSNVSKSAASEPARPAPPGPWGHDEAEAQHRDPTQSLHVRLNGQPSADWTPTQLAVIASAQVRTKKGENREGWWLDEVSKTLVGPNARVVALSADDKRIPVDGSKRLLLRVMRDGHYKVSDESYATVLRDVDQLEIERP